MYQEVADVHMMGEGVERWAGPVLAGSEEAKEVDLFLENEHAVMQKAFEDGLGSGASPPPQVEVLNV